MILISHRGNIDGPRLNLENTPDYIRSAIGAGYLVEVDLWITEDGGMYLGHDSAEHKININFLTEVAGDVYIHAKNYEAFRWLCTHNVFKFFWHIKEEFTLTSDGKAWCYPSEKAIPFGINLLPEMNDLKPKDLEGCLGICSDYISQYRDLK